MHNEYTTSTAEKQEDATILLQDTSATGKTRPWAKHHKGSLALAAIYDYMADPSGDGSATDPHAAQYLALSQRLSACAPWAVFEQGADSKRLQASSFCRVRLCPMCQWRRSLKLAGQARMVVAEADRRRAIDTHSAQGWRWLMLTVTLRNVPAADLSQTIDHLHNSLHRLTKRKQWPAAGWLRATEITYNAKSDTYHPHMHLLLCVPPSYYSGREYMSQAAWAALWQQVARLDYTPVVDVRAINPRQDGSDIGPAIAEVAKYGAKPADYIRPGDVDTSMRVIATLTDYLDGRRLTSWGGCLKEAAAALKLDDAETGNLIHITDEQSTDDAANIIHNYVLYRWAVGWGDYAQADSWADMPAWVSTARKRAQAATDKRIIAEADRRRAADALDIASVIGAERRRRKNGKKQEIPRPVDTDSGSCAEQTSLYEMGGNNTGRA